MTLSKGIIRADLIAAKQAIEFYDEKGIRDIKNNAAYHLQQAAEKLIKYPESPRSPKQKYYSRNLA